jgi:hypothetical protein
MVCLIKVVLYVVVFRWYSQLDKLVLESSRLFKKTVNLTLNLHSSPLLLVIPGDISALLSGNIGRTKDRPLLTTTLHAEELFRKVQACQFVHAHGDQVCPANWKPGAETLKPSLDLVGQL